MLHRTGKNWLLNLHFPLQAAWLRQSDSAGSLCHLLLPFLALPQWYLTAPTSPTPAETHPELPVCWLRTSREHPCVHTSCGAGFLGGFTAPLGSSTCMSAAQRGWAGGGHTWGCAAQPAATPHWGPASAHPNTGIQQGHWSYKPQNSQALLQPLTSDYIYI